MWGIPTVEPGGGFLSVQRFDPGELQRRSRFCDMVRFELARCHGSRLVGQTLARRICFSIPSELKYMKLQVIITGLFSGVVGGETGS